MTSRRQHG